MELGFQSPLEECRHACEAHGIASGSLVPRQLSRGTPLQGMERSGNSQQYCRHGSPTSSRDCISPAVFRARITALADEYEHMRARLEKMVADNPHCTQSRRAKQACGADSGRSCLPLECRSEGGTPTSCSGLAPSERSVPVASPRTSDCDPRKVVLPHAPTGVHRLAESLSCNLQSPGAMKTRVQSELSRRGGLWEGQPLSKTLFWQHPLRYLVVGSTHFERFIGFVIFMNVAFMGFSIQLEIETVREGDDYEISMPMEIIELLFAAIYAIELAMRISVYRMDFFFNRSDKYWNVFDLILVLQSILDQLNRVTNILNSTGGNMSFLRAMRFMKMVKTLQMVRLMRSMREIRMIIISIMGSVRSMLWSLVLLAAVLYMFSLIFVQGASATLSQDVDISKYESYDATEDLHNDITEYWGSLGKAMTTLFMASNGGFDWTESLRPLWVAGFPLPQIFLMYISFFNFVILNIITAVFVETTIAIGNKDFQNSIQNELEKKEEYEDSLRLLFDEMDSSGDGEVSLQEFLQEVQNPKLLAFFASLEIEIADATHFFAMLSDQGRKKVTLSNFVTGCIRMRGGALAVDLHDLMIKHSAMQQECGNQLKGLMQVCDEHLTENFRILLEKVDVLADRFANSVRSSLPHVEGNLEDELLSASPRLRHLDL